MTVIQAAEFLGQSVAVALLLGAAVVALREGSK
jgi:hypothetical protein